MPGHHQKMLPRLQLMKVLFTNYNTYLLTLTRTRVVQKVKHSIMVKSFFLALILVELFNQTTKFLNSWIIPMNSNSLHQQTTWIMFDRRQIPGNRRIEKRVLKQLRYSPSLVSVPCKTPLHQVDEPWVVNWFIHDLVVPISDFFIFGPKSLVVCKWCLTIHHLVKNTTKRPNIRRAPALDNVTIRVSIIAHECFR